MPTSIYMASGDEFMVTSSDYAAIARLMDEGAPRTAEFHAIWYTDPAAASFEDDGWPTYREQRITILTAHIVAVEELIGAQAEAISRAMRHAIDQM
jgi:hypothetical protein